MSEALRAALAEVEATRREIDRLAREHPERWKTDYARQRPLLDTRIAALSREGDAWLRAHGDAAQREEFARLLAAARDTALEHQSRWPVLVINPESAAYHESVKAIDARFAELVAFVNRLPR